jgi:membrane protein
MNAVLQFFKRILWRLYETYEHWQKDEAAILAAATSYYMALSFFPLLLILLSIMGFLLDFTGWGIDAQQRFLKLLADNVAPSLAAQVKDALSSVKTNAVLSGPVGLITLLLAAMAVFAHFEKAFDRIWNIPAAEYLGIFSAVRRILWQRLRAFLLLLGVWLLVIAAFLFNMTLASMQNYASQYFDISAAVWNLLTVTTAVGTNWLLFTLLYKLLPKAPVQWRAAAGGGLLASIIWEAGRRILAVLVIASHYSVYGVVGAFIAVMLWVYYAAAAVFFGAEFVQVIGIKSPSEKTVN